MAGLYSLLFIQTEMLYSYPTLWLEAEIVLYTVFIQCRKWNVYNVYSVSFLIFSAECETCVKFTIFLSLIFSAETTMCIMFVTTHSVNTVTLQCLVIVSHYAEVNLWVFLKK